MDLKDFKLCIVGSGFFGSVIAERVTSELGLPVLILERRRHVGGNCYTEVDAETGIEVHQYGSHIFHTSSQKIWDYVNRFSKFNEYRHRVLTQHRGEVFSMPINLYTINQFYRKAMSPTEAQAFLEHEIRRDQIPSPRNFEEKAISLLGRPLYEAFIKGYSEKQWETDLKNLPTSIINRLPVRYTYNDRYFDDTYEGIPLEGYSGIFSKMLSHPKIHLRLNSDFFELRNQLAPDCLVIYTGPIDRYYDYAHGHLGWRTVELQKEVHQVGNFQGTSVMNYADLSVPFTRIHEFRHFHPERAYASDKTVIFKEFSKRATNAQEEPYYPINTEDDKAVFNSYKERMAAEKRVIFGGRLATYKYYDMHQVIGSALACFENTVLPNLRGQPVPLVTNEGVLNA
jgi:UDP-galactopyranose mutase